MILKEKHILNYERYLVNLDLAEVTFKKYLLYLKHYRELYADHFNQNTIDAFLKLKTSPNHKAMIKHLIDSLKRDDTLSQDEQIEISRLVILKQTGKKEKKKLRYLLREEINKLLDNVKLKNELDTVTFKLMVLWQFSGGLRIHELTHIKYNMINFSGRTKFFEDDRDKLKHQKILLPASITKGEKEGYVYITTKAYLKYIDYLSYLKTNKPEILYRIVENQTSIWGKMTKKKYSDTFHKQCYKILNKELTTHCLRHSRATDLLIQGMPVQEVKDFMRHENLATTDNYAHLVDNKVETSLQNIN